MLRHNLKVIDKPETLILRYKDLKSDIKKLESECEYIKKNLISNYLNEDESVLGENDQVLATYKTSIRISFQTKKFELDHKDLFDLYLDATEIKTFLIK